MKINRDNLPHLVDCFVRKANNWWYTFWLRLAAFWWGVDLAPGCSFFGRARFFRHPRSRISIGYNSTFRSSSVSNMIGVNRPCILSTLKEGAVIDIGSNCGFSGTVIGCALSIAIGKGVRCGANTLITDTDWHTDDPRSSPDAPVIIGENVWLGANVTILKGVTIGENTFIAAGSLVTNSLPSKVIAAGSPARVIRPIKYLSTQTLTCPP
jgi:acetyltransferase-like isoleucine patch superfamily enzyme